MKDRRLEGQVALVTGASSGIGAAVSRGLGEAGALVGVNYLRRSEEAKSVVAAIEEAGSRAVAIRADVSREEDVERMFEEAAERLGPLDILVSNAGIQKDADFVEMTLDEWNQVMGVNLTGAFLCARSAVRAFLRRGPSGASRARGKVIFMSSVHERIPWAGRVNYAASKGGLALLMKSVSQEVARHGIRVNSVAPGAIRTPINRDAWETEEARRKLRELIPYGRIGEPEDVAGAVVWLASDASDYVNGATLFIDGGMTLYPGFSEGGG